jgi:hypothetical protein
LAEGEVKEGSGEPGGQGGGVIGGADCEEDGIDDEEEDDSAEWSGDGGGEPDGRAGIADDGQTERGRIPGEHERPEDERREEQDGPGEPQGVGAIGPEGETRVRGQGADRGGCGGGDEGVFSDKGVHDRKRGRLATVVAWRFGGQGDTLTVPANDEKGERGLAGIHQTVEEPRFDVEDVAFVGREFAAVDVPLTGAFGDDEEFFFGMAVGGVDGFAGFDDGNGGEEIFGGEGLAIEIEAHFAP